MGGEPVYRRDVDLYKKYFSAGCIYVNGLGSTETGAICQYFIDKETQIDGNNVPVGYALEDTEVLLLDDDRKEVGLNDVGEIAVKSRYIAPGYWRNPELTGAAFLPDSEGGTERIYCTGDLARRLTGGCLVHLGRKDFQVKVRGQRVETAEIEKALLDMGVFREAVVIAFEDIPVDKRLVAYLVPSQKPTPTTGELRTFLRAKLPDYMVPSTFMLLDNLPLTPSGKLDRHGLPSPVRERAGMHEPFVAPRTPTEEALAEIWAEILKVKQVGIHDNFFDLGGQSLLGTQLVSRVRDILKLEVPWRSLFEAPTVAALAELIETTRWAAQGVQASLGDAAGSYEEGEL
jgi:acyl-coenzyme A synthetase/AMP-(fatty) acid ligase